MPMSESELDPWIFTDRGLDSQWVRRDEQQQPEEPGHKRRRTRFAPLERRWNSVNTVNSANAVRTVDAVETANAAETADAVRRSFNADRRPQSPHFPLNHFDSVPPNLNGNQTDLHRKVQIIGKSVQGLIKKTRYYKLSLKKRSQANTGHGSPIDVVGRLIAIVNKARRVDDEGIVSNVRKDLFKAVKGIRDARTVKSWQRTADNLEDTRTEVDKILKEIKGADKELAAILKASRLR